MSRRQTNEPKSPKEPPATPAKEPEVAAHDGTDLRYIPSAPDIFTLSEKLGAATLAEVGVLTAGYTDAELIAIGNDYSTARVTADAERILGVAETFFAKAPTADRDALDLTLPVVRIGAWTAAQDSRTHEELKTSAANARSRTKGVEAQAEQTVEQARIERKKLATQISAVGGSPATEAAVAQALAPAAHGEANPGPHVSIERLVAEGRRLLASGDDGVKLRAELMRLNAERLGQSEELGKKAKKAAKVLDGPKVVVTQEKVDWWDGATYVILQLIVGAFQGARSKRPEVPSVGFVSLRARHKPAADSKK